MTVLQHPTLAARDAYAARGGWHAERAVTRSRTTSFRSAVLVIIPGICYLVASFLYASKANWPLAVTYAGYFAGNVGLLMLDLSQK
jgi:hypothetical protein